MKKVEGIKVKKQVANADRLLTVEELASRWSVSKGGIYNKINQRKLKCVKIFGAVRFKESEILRIEKAR